VLLNDHTIYEHILDDRIFMGVMGILECEPHEVKHRRSLGSFLLSPRRSGISKLQVGGSLAKDLWARCIMHAIATSLASPSDYLFEDNEFDWRVSGRNSVRALPSAQLRSRTGECLHRRRDYRQPRNLNHPSDCFPEQISSAYFQTEKCCTPVTKGVCSTS